MNIDIANKLYQLRREKGLSQEELAAKLGISRQAVSKWERAEAAPDTDNLITLANLYNVSLDELLLRSDKVDDDSVSGESVPEEDSTPGSDSESATEPDSESDHVYTGEVRDATRVNFKKGAINVMCDDGTHVHVGLDGVIIRDGADNDNVHVGWDGIHVDEAAADRIGREKTVDSDGTVYIRKPGKTVTIYPDGRQHVEKPDKTVDIDADGTVHVTHKGDGNVGSARYHIEWDEEKGFWHYVPWPICTLIAFLLIGFLVPGGTAIAGGGVIPQGWVWGWLCFLTIPIYYSLFFAIQHRDPSKFSWIVLTALIFFVAGYFWSLWHPAWIIFLTIPIYYPIAHFIKKCSRKKHPEYAARFDDNDDDDDDNDDDDDVCGCGCGARNGEGTDVAPDASAAGDDDKN